MKQNTNIFVTISVIVLMCCQLHGLSKDQSVELNRLKQELDARYAEDIRLIEPKKWLEENLKIIDQIEELDFSAASTYKEKQRSAFAKIQAKPKIIEAKSKTKSKEKESIGDKIGKLDSIIADYMEKLQTNPDLQVNFNLLNNAIVKFIIEIKKIQNRVKSDDALYVGVGNLVKGVVKLLEIKKDQKKLLIDNFNQTAQVIQSMKRNLGIRPERKRKKSLAESIAMQKQIFSMLKKSLYDVYEAKQAAENKITIVYDYAWTIPIFDYQFSTRLRSKPQDNLLDSIPPFFEKEEGWRERLTKMVKKWYQPESLAE